MKISEIIKNKTTISFEIFPPKNKEDDLKSIYQTIDELSKLQPDFISVTYGAGGSTKGKTVEIASTIKNKYHIESLAHLTCLTSSINEVKEICNQLKEANVENILALRGDYPKDGIIMHKDFRYAKDLEEYINKEFKDYFCLAGACYPEGHQEALSLEDDLKALKQKVDAGAKYLITQVFYDNQYYYDLVSKARSIGINVPIIAGIMPITNIKSIKYTTKMCGCTLPSHILELLDYYESHDMSVHEVGIHLAVDQIIDLIAHDVEGIHIYTMNKPEITQAIFERIPSLLKEINHE